MRLIAAVLVVLAVHGLELWWVGSAPLLGERARTELCARSEVVTGNRATDRTDVDAIAQLVALLPEDYRNDAALFYYPYGGAPSGTDTSGNAAMRAGGRLLRLYERNC